MNINNILNIIQIILGILIVIFVLLQQQDTGFYSQGTNMPRTRRGTEKLLYNMTIIVGILFILISIANFLVA